jgi:signal transduction histidine kinase
MGALRGSTRFRILGWVLIPVLVVLVVSWVAAWTLLASRLDERIDTELLGEMSELRLTAEQGVDQRTGAPFTDVRSLLEQHIDRSIPDPNETMFVMIDGEVEYRSTDDPPVRLDLDSALLQDVAAVDEVTLGNLPTAAGDVRWVAVPVRAGGREGVFVVGIFADLEGSGLADVMGRFAAFGFGALLLAGGLGWYVSGRLLAPLRHMRQTAQQISETDLSRRIPLDETSGDEVTELSRTFNDMLSRLEGAFTAQREFIDDAGHELRTPLTIVQGHLELLEDDPVARDQTLALVLDELSRMNRIVHDLQTLTKANQPGFVRRQLCDLEGLLDEILVKASALGDRRWELHSAPGMINVDRQRVTQAMLQLASNAVRHTEAGQPIVIGGQMQHNQVELWVGDSGPGIAEDQRSEVLHRFRRGTDSDGAGLGLALVNAIATAHHGQFRIGDSPLGGAEMRLLLPSTVNSGALA